ncbi:lipoprotein-releasing system permease protein [Lacibacter cauensis]|uniref:Lipoprotein-releasing system permease protein n=1 Tax=Lacibacter cauensis TaxID=510947 RepID=A0A562SS07_9BACT|nr:FtsX-like permease family protein [Lacibacter cauensis]TWI83606.1 lipoprotein-releasing system permease protein [Lacibacter cauensis]
MNFLFAWRYFRSKKSTNAINIIAWITVLAIAVGTAALVVVLSIFNGFEGLVKTLYSSFYPDIRITAKQQKIMLLDDATVKKIKLLQNVKGLSMVVEENVHLQNGDYRTNAVIKGVDDAYVQTSGVKEMITSGQFELGSNETPALVLGVGIEGALNLRSDRSVTPVTAYLPKRGVTSTNPFDAISTVNLQPTGAFSIQQDFDNKYVLTNLDILKEMLGLKPNEYSAAELKLKDIATEKETIAAIQQILGNNYLVENRYQQNRSLFGVMQMEKWAIYGILSLILIIASFNMIGALTMLVLEKEQDIKILQAMGAGKSFIQRIFLTEGVLLALIGSVIGIVLALIFSYLQVTFKLIPLQGSFVIDYYPVEISITDILLIVVTVFVIGLLASWIPSVKAAKQKVSLRAQ